MTHPGHGKTECSCGAVLARWRGWEGPHKEVQVVRDGCQACVGKLRSDLDHACVLLKRAAQVITSYEIDTKTETEVLPAIGAFLGRVGK